MTKPNPLDHAMRKAALNGVLTFDNWRNATYDALSELCYQSLQDALDDRIISPSEAFNLGLGCSK